MDSGLCDGNYYDYEDDETARLREGDIAQEIGPDSYWEDPAFPPDGRALYFDPELPPKGALPPSSLSWFRICQRGIEKCFEPTLFFANESSCIITQGALGNSYFTNALRVLACDPKYIHRLFVSTKYSHLGLYTIKFCKQGKWRYVHIDDRIACRQSGRVHFCRNSTPNETFAMLLEKAYAKLHGCYESLLHGLLEKCLYDLTASANVRVLRKELLNPETIYDTVWEELDRALDDKRLVACRRISSDPFSDKALDRLGIKLDVVYQVLDVCSAHAGATSTMDALDVGLVCIRNLQEKETGGRFTGRWSYGHPIWAEYPEIGRDMSARTDELEVNSPFYQSPQSVANSNTSNSQSSTKKAKEKIAKQLKGVLPDDPFADITFSDEEDEEEDNFAIDKVLKQTKNKIPQPGVEGFYWIQIEDFIELFNRVYLINDITFKENILTKRYISYWVPGDYIAGSGGPPLDRSIPSPNISPRNNNNDNIYGNDDDDEDDDEEDEQPDPFTDNPMYPFVVSEPTTVNITLYQSDRRWSVSRIGSDQTNPMLISSSSYTVRDNQIDACMNYTRAIGFVVVKLSGLKVRVTTFSMNRIIANSEYIQFSNNCNNIISLTPGRYAIVPFTDIVISNLVMEYCLVIQYKEGAIDMEINDIIKERPIDSMPSDDEDENTDELIRNEKRKLLESAGQYNGYGKCPLLLLTEPWEWKEEIEEMASIAIYEQVNDLAYLLRSLKKDIRDLQKEKLKK